MKASITIMVFFLLLTSYLNGQDLKRYEITLSGNYRANNEDIAIGNYNANQETNSSIIKFGINQAISAHLMIGIGVDYLHRKDQYNYDFYSGFYLPDFPFVLADQPEIETTTFIPSINLKYVKPLSEKFILGLSLSNGYGFRKSELKSISEYYVYVMFADPGQLHPMPPRFIGIYEEDQDDSYYRLSIEPEACYYLSNALGIKIKGELYRYDSITKHQIFFNRKTHQVTWTIGISWRI
ncbi:hypothetical protein ACT29H_09070 [Thermophagus sp. OGC60D27]|uniref:hypothetical protein n=1 Tax=Thermophagus sp. OGC60D27 TaxID=3458415 RepID=UPI00403829C8